MPNASKPAFFRLLRLLAEASGLLHDIGKANLQFQAALRGQEGPQRVRHDLLGHLMLCQALLRPEWVSDLAWLDAAADPAVLFAPTLNGDGLALPDAVRKCLHSQNAEPTSALDSWGVGTAFSAARRSLQPLGFVLSWLVVTHHRLISGWSRTGDDLPPNKPTPPNVAPANAEVPRLEVFLNRGAATPLRPSNLTARAGAMPWDCPKWSAAFARVATSLAELLRAHPEVLKDLADGDALLSSTTLLLRPSLMFGDRLASSNLRDPVLRAAGVAFDSEVFYANTDATGIGPGDSLSTHLISTGEHAVEAFDLLMSGGVDMGRLDTSELGANSLLRTTAAPGTKFGWQAQTVSTLAGSPETAKNPFFCAVLAQPGSGKTLGGIALLARVSNGQLRVSSAHGRVSLTQQTATAYLQQAGFPAGSVVTRIGDPLGQQLADRLAALAPQGRLPDGQVAAVAQRGSESLEAEDEYWSLGTAEAAARCWRRGLDLKANAFSAREVTLLDAPVLVSTVDNAVRSVVEFKAARFRDLLRLATADLLIDEVDDWAPTDHAALARLVHAAGVFGRRVVLMSGTMPLTLLTQLHAAWLCGLGTHRRLHGDLRPATALLVSDLTSAELLKGAGGAEFAAAAQRFCSALMHHLSAGSARVIYETVPLGVDDDYFDRVEAHAAVMHARHQVIEPSTGQAVSLGCVRFNTVGAAQRFSRRLLDRPDVPDRPLLRLVCLHAQMPQLHRQLKERCLKGLLVRSDAQPVPLVPEILQALTAAGGRGLMVLVITTPIIETGRDYDFDFCITEPQSNKALSQVAGRVLRHRTHKPRAPNLGVMSYPLKAHQQLVRHAQDGTPAKRGARTFPYGRTGVQDDLRLPCTDELLVRQPRPGGALARQLQAAGIRCEAGTQELVLDASGLLGLLDGAAVTPAPCLMAPARFADGRLSAIAEVQLRNNIGDLTRGGSAPANSGTRTVAEFLASGSAAAGRMLFLDDRYSWWAQFRQRTGQRRVVQVTLQDDLCSFEYTKNYGVARRQVISHRTVTFENPERSLLRLDQHIVEKVDGLCCELGLVDREVLLRASTTEDRRLQQPFGFHPELGFMRGE